MHNELLESITAKPERKFEQTNENLILGLSCVSAREWHYGTVTLFKVRHTDHACIYRYATDCLRTDGLW